MDFSWVPNVWLMVAVGAAFAVVWIMFSILYRTVVPTNTVHIVQSRKRTIPYGTDQASGVDKGNKGNVYYRWPRWIPLLGVTVTELPVSNFDLSLKEYEAYDKDRVPFKVDVTAFFRIKDTALAAQRVKNIEELKSQLSLIVQGAVRKVLASDTIDKIMLERAKFGEDFTKEVKEQLQEWGVESVKSMELMDIRDGHDSQVISNIMAKKTSHIEMESRQEVAANIKAAETAEIDAKKEVDVRRQEAEQAVGQRTAEKEKEVGVAQQRASQEVLSQERETKTRQMDVLQVEQVRRAEIAKAEGLVAADQDKQTRVIVADGHLEAERRRAQGIEAVGTAEGMAEKAKLMAPVAAQIELATAIAEKPGYQQYLQVIEAIKAYLEVGSKQAEALQKADIKVIANTGKPTEGVGNVMDLFSTQGGTNLAGMVEAFAQTPMGKILLSGLVPKDVAIPAPKNSGDGTAVSASESAT